MSETINKMKKIVSEMPESEEKQRAKQGVANLEAFEAIATTDKTMETTIPCIEEGCCGCLNANYDETKIIWIFHCNECSKEGGRGSVFLHRHQSKREISSKT